MIRFLSLLAFSMMIFGAPLSAQETDNFVLLEPAAEEEKPVKDITVEDYEERLELAEAMHEILNPHVEEAAGSSIGPGAASKKVSGGALLEQFHSSAE